MRDTDAPAQARNEAGSPRAVFVDIDGTLCDSRQRVPDSAIRALAQARERGHRLFVCTGRSVPEVYPRFVDLGFEGIVGGAGGYAAVGNKVLLDERMPREHVDVLTALWEDLDAFFIWQGPDQMGPSEGYLDFFVPRAGKHPEDWIEYAQSISPFIVDIDGGAFTKVTAYVPSDKASLERVSVALPEGYRAIIGSVGAAGYVPFEIIPDHLSKAVGMQAVCDTSASPCHAPWPSATLTTTSRPWRALPSASALAVAAMTWLRSPTSLPPQSARAALPGRWQPPDSSTRHPHRPRPR